MQVHVVRWSRQRRGDADPTLLERVRWSRLRGKCMHAVTEVVSSSASAAARRCFLTSPTRPSSETDTASQTDKTERTGTNHDMNGHRACSSGNEDCSTYLCRYMYGSPRNLVIFSTSCICNLFALQTSKPLSKRTTYQQWHPPLLPPRRKSRRTTE